MTEIRPYRPSNGTEGEGFMEHFCYHCANDKWCHTQVSGDLMCDILGRALALDIGDESYPVEWQYDSNGHPTCTAHKPWDWGRDDGNGLNEPSPPEPYDPNQLCFPFMLDKYIEVPINQHSKTLTEVAT